MKNLIVAIALLLSVITCKSQTYDKIPTELVQVHRSGDSSFLTLNKVASIKSRFGAPETQTSEYWEMDSITVQKYDYNGNEFYIHNNKLVSFTITSADYFVGNSEQAIRVGNNISSLAKWYPNSFKSREDGAMILLVSFATNDPIASAEYLAIVYNGQGIITKIDVVHE
ncbi:MAG TPA: hypothetical protein VGD90_10240 [Sphingobacteriaceae bacterium]